MKAYYNPEGDACWEDTSSVHQEVEIVAWDRDKYFTFKDSIGELHADKGWKFSFKRSNKLWELPYGYLDEVAQATRKDAAKELKERRKKSVVYRVKQVSRNGELYTSTWKDFKSLKKALNFCKANPACIFLHVSFRYKGGSISGPLLEKENGEWYYSNGTSRVSTKTLVNFCWKN